MIGRNHSGQSIVMLLLVITMKYLKTVKLLIVTTSFCFLMLVSATPTLACDCAAASGAIALTYADISFQGVVTNIELLEPQTAYNEPRIKVTFSVSRVWKGNVEKTFVLHTTQNSYSCAGYIFSKDREYLVMGYANDEETTKKFNEKKKTFGTNPCGATLEISRAKEALKELGKGKKPKDRKL